MWLKTAEYIKDYMIRVVFEDNSIKTIDLKPFIQKSQHPAVKKFLDINLFKKFKVEFGSLCWEGGQFDISHQAIYRGDFDAKKLKSPKREIKKDKEIIK